MLRCFINCFIFCFWMAGFSQPVVVEDSVPPAQRYGLRVGVDASKPIRSLFDGQYKGIEIMGDYRLSRNLYIAAEIGTEEKTTEEDFYTFTTSGSYIKGGFNYNLYDNWYGMENLIYIGLRYGFSTHSQTVDSYTLYNTEGYWGEDGMPGTNPQVLQTHKGLTAHWVEIALGMQVEVLHNLYLGGSIRLNRLLTDPASPNFPNLWLPGFNKVTHGSAYGVGYNYTLSYFIPIYKKTPKKSAKKS